MMSRRCLTVVDIEARASVQAFEQRVLAPFYSGSLQHWKLVIFNQFVSEVELFFILVISGQQLSSMGR